MEQKDNPLRNIPHMDKLINHKIIEDSRFYRHEITEAIRDVLSNVRETIQSGSEEIVPNEDELARRATALAMERSGKSIRRVINGTGVVLHSNLGRACLSKNAADAVFSVAKSYSTLEYETEIGARGSRTSQIEGYLCDITEGESALVVNNNAAAVLLALSTLASSGEIIVSRGELVEIGGAFRVPEIIELCGGKLREVGTTNKTKITDYEKAINDKTAAILKVHTSNYKIVGFTASTSIGELATLGKNNNIPIIEDIGSGALINMTRFGINDEPLAEESLRQGADIVTFSGDKLLGGPQCGIVVGAKKYIDIMRKHPLYRALRVDKLTIAALEATLRVYYDYRVAEKEIPTLQMLLFSEDELQKRAEDLSREVNQFGGHTKVLKTSSVVGGGSVPGISLVSYAISPMSRLSSNELDKRLRELEVPIIGRIVDERFLLDVRTIFDEDFVYVAKSVAKVQSL